MMRWKLLEVALSNGVQPSKLPKFTSALFLIRCSIISSFSAGASRA